MAWYSRVTSAVKSAASGVSGAAKAVASKVTGGSSSSGSTGTSSGSTSSGSTSTGGGSSSLGSGGGTYNPSTGVYIDSSGQGFSTATPPTTAIITSSGGGGGTYYTGSGTYISPSGQGFSMATAPAGARITTTQLNQQIARDIGIVQSPTIISTYKPPTLTDIPSYVKANIKQLGVPKTIQGAGQIAGGVFTRGLTKVEKGLTKGTEFILRKGGVAESLAVALQEEKKQASQDVIKFNIKSEKVSNEIESFNKKWENREITTEKEYAQYEKERTSIETKQETLKTKSETLTEDLKKLDEKERKIERSPRTFAKTLVRSAAVTAVTLPLVVAKLGVGLVTRPVKTGEEFVGGVTQIPSAIVQRPATAIGEIAGSLIGAQIFSAGITKLSNINKVSKANEAKAIISRSDVEVASVKGITTEAQIVKLSIPQSQKTELLAQLKAGQNIRLVEYKIKAPSALEQAKINKVLPIQNIKVAEVTTSANNLISRTAIGQIKVGGKKEFIQNIYSRGVGVQAEGKTIMQSVTLAGQEGKPISSIAKTLQVSKGQVKKVGDIRFLKSESKAAEILKEASKRKPITYESLKQLTQQDYSQATIRTGKYAEVQRLTATGKIAIKYPDETAFLFSGKEYQVLGGAGRSRLIPKPFEYTKVPSYSKIKGFENVKTTTIKAVEQPPVNLKAFTKVKPSTKLIEEGYPTYVGGTQVQSIEGQLNQIFPTGDYSQSILGAAQRGVSSLDVGRTPVVLPVFKTKTGYDIKTTPVISPIQIDAQKLNQRFKVLSKTGISPAVSIALTPLSLQRVSQALTPMITTKQITKQIQQLQQPIQPFFPTIPTIPIPKIPFIPPILPAYPMGMGFGKPAKKIKGKQTREYKYAAGLGAAVGQRTPIQVTKKQFKSLVQRPKFYSLPVLEIVPEEILRKKLKTAVQF